MTIRNTKHVHSDFHVKFSAHTVQLNKVTRGLASNSAPFISVGGNTNQMTAIGSQSLAFAFLDGTIQVQHCHFTYFDWGHQGYWDNKIKSIIIINDTITVMYCHIERFSSK